jgi:hypothetical protein
MTLVARPGQDLAASGLRLPLQVDEALVDGLRR